MKPLLARSWVAIFAAALATGASVAGGDVASAAEPRMRVAVLAFQSGAGTAGDLGSLGVGLQSMVTTDLAGAGVLDLVERARLNDVQAELKLAASALVDPASAVRIGKLAGATHLVVGTFTVVGGTMRLDARLVGVADGKIVLAAKIEGARDAFFELEKDLVNRLLASFGVTLGPKQRAEVARIHTADFEAFRSFSDGVALFDARRYDEALAALHLAEGRDHHFELAASTIAEYERIVAALRSKASAIEAAQAGVAKARRDQRAQAILDRAGKLASIAATTGGGTAGQLQRLGALGALTQIYDGGHGGSPDDHDRLAESEDDFALHRAAHPFWRAYVAEWMAAFPRLRIGLGMDHVNPNRPEIADAQILQSLTGMGRISRKMLLDRRQEAELRRRILALADNLSAAPTDLQGADAKTSRRRQRLAAAENLRAVGDHAGSVEAYTRLASGENNASELNALAGDIDENRRREAEIAASPHPEWTRELLLGRAASSRSENTVVIGGGRRMPTDDDGILAGLRDLRRLPECGMVPTDCYVLVGSSPVWQVRKGPVATGPRTDPLRGSELRYRDTGGYEPLVVVDGLVRADLTVDFTLAYDVPGDFWRPILSSAATDAARRRREALDAARPDVAFAFGMKDIDAKSRRSRGYELVISADAVRLVETEEPSPHSDPRLRVLAEQRLPQRQPGKRLAVSLRVDARAVSGKVDGQPFSFPAPAERSGFYGFRFRGAGYGAVTSWTLKAPG